VIGRSFTTTPTATNVAAANISSAVLPCPAGGAAEIDATTAGTDLLEACGKAVSAAARAKMSIVSVRSAPISISGAEVVFAAKVS
jgi:hypothetical protein